MTCVSSINFVFSKLASLVLSKVFLNTFSRRILGKLYGEVFILYCFFTFLNYLYTTSNCFWLTTRKKYQFVFFLNLSICVVRNTFASIGTCWGIISSSLSTFVVWSAKEFKRWVNIWGNGTVFLIYYECVSTFNLRDERYRTCHCTWIKTFKVQNQKRAISSWCFGSTNVLTVAVEQEDYIIKKLNTSRRAQVVPVRFLWKIVIWKSCIKSNFWGESTY